MFIQFRKLTVKEGTASMVIDHFSKPGIIEEQPGFVDLKVLQKKRTKGDEEVVILITWESEEDWKNWEKSDAHIAGHRANKNKAKPDHILNMEVSHYEVHAVKENRPPSQ